MEDLADQRGLSVVFACAVLAPLLWLLFREVVEPRLLPIVRVAAAVLLAVQASLAVRSSTAAIELLTRADPFSGEENHAGVDLALLIGSLLAGAVVSWLSLRSLPDEDAAHGVVDAALPAAPDLPPVRGWSDAEAIGDAPHHDPWPAPPYDQGWQATAPASATAWPPTGVRPEWLLFGGIATGLFLMLLAPALGVVSTGLGFLVTLADLNGWSILGAALGGLLMGLGTVLPLLRDDEAPESTTVVGIAAAGLAAVGLASALPWFVAALRENEYWSMIGSGGGTGLLVPIAVYAIGRSWRDLRARQAWLGAVLALVGLGVAAACNGLGRPEFSPFD